MRSRRRWREELRAEREFWRRHHAMHHAMHHARRHRHGPWWLQGKLRLRIFLGFGVALAAGAWVGVRQPHWWQLALILSALWMVAGAMAWRLTRPLVVTIAAARAIGDGKLDTRVDVGHRGELAILASALNHMAARIEQQLRDQKALLAAVSHELRTPLGHLRVMIETAREQADWRALDAVERELLALDDLVARLLASSRLEFGRIERRPLDVAALTADVALASGVSADVIAAEGDATAAIDPTLVRRAIANLIDNAARHGGGVTAIRIERRADEVVVEVDDAGPGLPADRVGDVGRAFVPSTGGGLGLGLALVARIAAAHDGRSWAGERPGGGARVGLSLAVAPRAEP